jgi:hypothetical protein
MATSSNERFMKTEGILNSCQINVIIPALIKQLGKIAYQQKRNDSFDAEYNSLLEHFNAHFETQLNLQQLHGFLTSKTYFEQQFILDAVLRRYMSSHLIRDQESNGVVYEDQITKLTSYDTYQENDGSVYPGRYPMMPYNDAINYLFKPLGFNLKINDSQEGSQTYVERNLGSIQQVLNPISTIEIYGSGDHYNLAQVVGENLLPGNNVFKKAHQFLSDAVTSSGAVLVDHRFDKDSFDLITDRVEQILETLKDDTKQELGVFLSHEVDLESHLDMFSDNLDALKQHGYTDEQISELTQNCRNFKELVFQTLTLQFVGGDPILESHYQGKNKDEVEALDKRLAAQLQAEEIGSFKASFR